MGKRRVFILGAGFSRQAGMPLATELTPLLLEERELKGLAKMQEWVADLQGRIAALESPDEDPSGFQLNVEQLFDFAKYDEEVLRMKQQLCPVGRNWGDTPWNTAKSIKTWLAHLEEQLVHVIWERQKEANLAPISAFSKHLRLSDSVLTFNYDTLVECALSGQGKTWNHGLDDKDNGGVPILKMHGSVDWMLLKRGQEWEGGIKLFSKRDINAERNGRSPDDGERTPGTEPKKLTDLLAEPYARSPCEEQDETEYGFELWRAKDMSSFDYRLGLAGLGRYKPLHELPGSALTWYGACKALKEAEEIYVIGFSMSPYDTMTRFQFSTVVRTRQRPPEKVVVIDPNAIELAKALSFVFGQSITLMAHQAERTDWNALLR